MKKLFPLLTLLFAAFSLQAQTWPVSGVSGSGIQADPWQISDTSHLASLARYVNAGNGAATAGKHYRLMNDLDLTGWDMGDGKGWNPIGDNSSGINSTRFSGNFHGGGHVIKNLTINRPTTKKLGFFGIVANGSIDSLGLTNISVSGGSAEVGGLVGHNDGGTINSCYVSGSVQGASQNIGGLVGYNVSGVITQSYATGKVSGPINVGGNVGGLVGYTINTTSLINNCYATNCVSGNTTVGGLVGSAGNNAPISNSYATGRVSGSGMVGGILGNGPFFTIKNCVAANDSVTGSSNVGRVYGGSGGTLTNNYALDSMVVLVNGSPKSITNSISGADGGSQALASLQAQSFYTNTGNWNTAAWDFTNTWHLKGGKTFPLFKWQALPIVLSASAGPGGSISPAGDSTVNAGASVVYTITANNGYHIDSILVNGVNVGCRDAMHCVSTEYTFTNITGDSTIRAVFAITPVDTVEPKIDTITISGDAMMIPAFSPAITSYNVVLPCGEQAVQFHFVVANGDTIVLNGQSYTDSANAQVNKGMQGSLQTMLLSVSNSTGNIDYTFSMYTPYDSSRIIRPYDNMVEVINNPVHIIDGQAFTAYQWYLNGVVVNGANNGVFHTGNQPLSAGAYSLVGTYANGGQNKVCPQNVSAPQNVKLQAYPNPTTGKLTMDNSLMSGANNGQWTMRKSTLNPQPSILTIYNTSGVVLRTVHVSSENTEIDLSDLKPGTYFIGVGNERVKIIKK